ncbi:hypothetical protein D043_1074B, partial [Vibrio parahaemolyticus EKP-021]
AASFRDKRYWLRGTLCQRYVDALCRCRRARKCDTCDGVVRG